jgi:hypothetical protein
VSPAEVIADVHDTLVERNALESIFDLEPLAQLYAAIAKGERPTWTILPRDETGARLREDSRDEFVIYNTFFECFRPDHPVWQHIDVVDLGGDG